MPKLIIKQDNQNSQRQTRKAVWYSVAGLSGMLAVVAVTAYLFYKPIAESAAQLESAELSSAKDSVAKAAYHSLQAVLADLDAEYESLSASGVDDYQKNLNLLGKTEAILRHLDRMVASVEQLQLDQDEQLALANRHQFYKDYWQSKQHFRALRVSRFEQQPANSSESPEAATVAHSAESMVTEAEPVNLAIPTDQLVSEPSSQPAIEQPAPRRLRFAKPPPGMALPAGFCDLTKPGACQAETETTENQPTEPLLLENAVVADGAKVDLVEQLPLTDTLPQGMGLSAQPAEAVTLPENLTVERGSDALPTKQMFRFAKPPPGMKLPAGFCDLQNPESCQPASAEPTAVPKEADSEPAQKPVPNNDEVVAQPQTEPLSQNKGQLEGVLGNSGGMVAGTDTDIPAMPVSPPSTVLSQPELLMNASEQQEKSVKRSVRSPARTNESHRNPVSQPLVKVNRPGEKLRSRVSKQLSATAKPVGQPASRQRKTTAVEHDLRVLEQSLGIPLQ